jgi:Zn-dependent protease
VLLISIWQQYTNQPAMAIVVMLGIICGILMAIGIHEFSHAWMATRLGDDTAKVMGRLTLNPFAHIDPLGIFLFLIAGFGFGKPVPYNERALKHDTDEIKIALAGPISNIITALILFLPARIMIMLGIDVTHSLGYLFLDALVSINIILAVFNIIPIPPLDGSKVLNYFLASDAKESFERIGPFLLIALVFSSNFTGGAINVLSLVMNPLIAIANFIVRATII